MPETWPTITAVIVDYRKAERVLRNVASLMAQYDPERLEVVVVDNSVSAANAGRLEALRRHRNLRLVVNATNTGYTAACNAGARLGSGELLLLINPDIEWSEPGALRRLVRFLRDRRAAAIVGPRQVNEDGSRPATARPFPTPTAQVACRTWLRHLPVLSQRARRYAAAAFDDARTQPVDWLQSSCVLLRRSFWDRIGGLDERYFLFMADCDICWKAWEQGAEVWHLAEAVVTADGIRASAGGPLALLHSAAARHHLRDASRYHGRRFWSRPPRSAGMSLAMTALQQAQCSADEVPQMVPAAVETVPQ